MLKKVTIAGVSAEPGQKAYGVVKVPDLFADGQDLEIPFIIYNGAKDGPRVHLQIAQHPNEVYALNGIRRVIGDLDPKALSGVITFCLPNPVGFRFGLYYGRTITHDINRVLSGNPDGTVMERIVNSWWVNFVENKADYLIDFHGVPQETFVFYEAHGVSPDVPKEVNDKSERMAKLYSARVLKKETEAYGGGKSFRGACVDHGIPAIVPEVAVDGADISETGLRNILVDLGMIKGKIKLPHKQYILNWESDTKAAIVTNKKAGFFRSLVKVGDIVKKGNKLGVIFDPRTLQDIETLTAHRDGYVSSIQPLPVKSVCENIMQIDEILEEITNT
ncbi:succinylglutamate desuccinylase/aspartoacylase family protein [Candidatus Bathyarchaeota archaeon]|nr:succinylglutamate desuccinylase/aspartoacylase family protein [Candidatus Bathyarchaeota archaeon]